jgi:hypothetical protein
MTETESLKKEIEILREGIGGRMNPARPQAVVGSRPALTDWEAGQEVISAVDILGELMADMRDSHPEAYAALDKARRDIGEYFNGNDAFQKSHGFGLISHSKYPKGKKAKA